MPWTSDAGDAHAGFSQVAPWLPVDARHAARSVAVQEAETDSVLQAARAFLRWRRAQPALVLGSIRFLDAPEPVLAFVREHDGQSLLAVFNLSAQPVAWDLPSQLSPRWLELAGQIGAQAQGASLTLPAYAAAFAEI
jgi:alpha-glucosidase